MTLPDFDLERPLAWIDVRDSVDFIRTQARIVGRERFDDIERFVEATQSRTDVGGRAVMRVVMASRVWVAQIEHALAELPNERLPRWRVHR